jgi:hypothetical protein
MEQMARNGDTDLTEECVVEKFLHCMPKRYAQIVNSIETLLDFEQLTVKDVTGRLKAVQDREQVPDSEPGRRRQAAVHDGAVARLPQGGRIRFVRLQGVSPASTRR